MNQVNQNNIQTDTYLYAYQEQTLTETIAVVLGKHAAKMPMLTAREELAEYFLQYWAELCGAETAK